MAKQVQITKQPRRPQEPQAPTNPVTGRPMPY